MFGVILAFLKAYGTAIAATTAIASTAYAYYNAQQVGAANQAVAEANARTARGNAELSEMSAEIEAINTRTLEARLRRRGKETLGTKRSLLGKSGVETTTGTPLLVLEDTAADIELDVLEARYSGSLQASQRAAETAGYRQDTEIAKMAGQVARVNQRGQQGGALLTGISKFTEIGRNAKA